MYILGNNTLLSLLRCQIKHLEISIRDKKGTINARYALKIFSSLIMISYYLTDLTFSLRWIDDPIEYPFYDLSPKSYVSSTLTKLVVNLYKFEHCLHLLDGRFKYLSVFIPDIMTIYRSSSDIANRVRINMTIKYKKPFEIE